MKIVVPAPTHLPAQILSSWNENTLVAINGTGFQEDDDDFAVSYGPQRYPCLVVKEFTTTTMLVCRLYPSSTGVALRLTIHAGGPEVCQILHQMSFLVLFAALFFLCVERGSWGLLSIQTGSMHDHSADLCRSKETQRNLCPSHTPSYTGSKGAPPRSPDSSPQHIPARNSPPRNLESGTHTPPWVRGGWRSGGSRRPGSSQSIGLRPSPRPAHRSARCHTHNLDEAGPPRPWAGTVPPHTRLSMHCHHRTRRAARHSPRSTCTRLSRCPGRR